MATRVSSIVASLVLAVGAQKNVMTDTFRRYGEAHMNRSLTLFFGAAALSLGLGMSAVTTAAQEAEPKERAPDEIVEEKEIVEDPVTEPEPEKKVAGLKNLQKARNEAIDDAIAAEEKSYYIKVRKYVADHPDAADIANAYVDLIDLASEHRGYEAAKMHYDEFVKANAEHTELNSIQVAYANAAIMTAEGDIAHDAVIAAMNGSEEAMVVYEMGQTLAMIHGAQGNKEKAGEAWDAILSHDALAQYKAQLAPRKTEALEKLGSDFTHFEFTDMDGNKGSSADLKGKVFLVDFWGTWCPPCVREIPHLVEAYEEYHDKGFEMIGIAGGKSVPEATTAAFIKENNMNWIQVNDADKSLVGQFGVRSFPTNYLVNGEGKVVGFGLRGEGVSIAIKAALAAKPKPADPATEGAEEKAPAEKAGDEAAAK